MSDIRLVPAPISLTYDAASAETERYEREFHQMSEADEDPIGQWIKTTKVRGETSESDPVLLNLMVELYRKMDRIERILLSGSPSRGSELPRRGRIDAIGYEHFRLSDENLNPGERYYGRVEMPIYPKRDIVMFFEALTPSLAKIVAIHERDENEWGVYLMARERALIRQMKGRE